MWYEFEKKVWCAVATPQLFCENPNRVLSAEIPFLCRLFLRRLGQHFFFSCPSRSFSHFPPTDTPCHGNKIWNKIGYNSACVRAFFEIFAPIGGGFRGCAIECRQWHFFPTDPRCHGNEIWNKIGYCSASVKNFCKIFAFMGRFSLMGHRMLPIAFSPDRPPLPWQWHLGQN